MPSGLQTHPFAIPIRSKQLRTHLPINHKRRAATSIYQKKNRSNAKTPYQPSGAGAKQLQPG